MSEKPGIKILDFTIEDAIKEIEEQYDEIDGLKTQLEEAKARIRELEMRLESTDFECGQGSVDSRKSNAVYIMTGKRIGVEDE